MALFDSLVEPALNSVAALISECHMSPEEKQAAQLALADAGQKARQAAEDYDAKLNNIAGQNIRAEEMSGDAYTARARPTFLYMVIAILGFNYIVIPITDVFGSRVQPIRLPADLLTLFGVVIYGYITARSVDKTMALPGESQVSVLGIKASNKN
jgi:hypothetical protein